MIAVDTSALMAILIDEGDAQRCIDALSAQEDVIMSAATFAEALIVAGRRGLQDRMASLIHDSGFDILNVTQDTERRSAEAYSRFGEGVHPARLNYGDCFAYTVAMDHDCPLLFVGRDFAATDVRQG